MKNIRKIRKIANGYLIVDGFNEIYFKDLKDMAEIIIHDIKENIIGHEEYIFEYNINPFNKEEICHDYSRYGLKLREEELFHDFISYESPNNLKSIVKKK